MRRGKHKSGFALVLVLFVLALAGTILPASARRSSERALLARAAQETLQRKWAALSARATCLPAAERLLDQAAVTARDADPDAAPPTSLRITVTLGGTRFDFVVTDEQAKANVNLLAQRFGDAVMSDRLQSLQAGSREVLPAQLRPAEPPTGVIAAVPRRYASFDQIFATPPPATLLPAAGNEPAPADRLTCWGSGKLNLRRADDTTIHETLSDLVNETEFSKLQDLRKKVPGCSVNEALKKMEIDDKRAKVLRTYLTEASSCRGLWTVCRGPTRDWYRLDVVQDGDSENDSEEWTFLW